MTIISILSAIIKNFLQPTFYLIGFFLSVGLLPLNASSATSSSLAKVIAHYECLWWSEQQMEGLDPNNPPKKETIVSLSRWEYSDPIGVPHPDIVTLVVKIPQKVTGQVSVRIQWMDKRWSQMSPGRTMNLVSQIENMSTYKLDLRVAEEIHSKHPTRLRSKIFLNGQRIKVVDLPIYIND